jgi:uncharacterized protein (DUF736 family)
VVFTETGIEVGAAWKKTGKGKSYVSVRLDTPAFQAPFNAAMFPGLDQEGSFILIWDLPEPKDEAPAA